MSESHARHPCVCHTCVCMCEATSVSLSLLFISLSVCVVSCLSVWCSCPFYVPQRLDERWWRIWKPRTDESHHKHRIVNVQEIHSSSRHHLPDSTVPKNCRCTTSRQSLTQSVQPSSNFPRMANITFHSPSFAFRSRAYMFVFSSSFLLHLVLRSPPAHPHNHHTIGSRSPSTP